MVTIGRVGEFKVTDYDYVCYITRSVRNQIAGTYVIKDLSPSPELFNLYLTWKRQGRWNRQMFLDEYLWRFTRDMEQGNGGIGVKKMRQIAELSKYKNIALMCFCEDEFMCHRSIVGQWLIEMGAEVKGLRREYPEYLDWIF